MVKAVKQLHFEECEMKRIMRGISLAVLLLLLFLTADKQSAQMAVHIDDVEVRTDGLMLEVTNTSCKYEMITAGHGVRADYGWLDDYRLLYMQDGAWVTVSETGKISDVPMDAYVILPQETADIFVEWSPRYENLKLGTYLLRGELLQKTELKGYRPLTIELTFEI